ncbi:MAG: RNA ligase family protein [Alphaproteobacteria bacterium]
MTEIIKPPKPLGRKAYGSIAHLSCSRIGPGDHFVHAGQEIICTEKPRKGDRIIVTEKLDGACMAVANINGRIVALSRAGYLSKDTPYEHLKLFGDYVSENHDTFAGMLAPGERIVGEWLGMAHGTLYDSRHELFNPFVAFDIFRGNNRILYDEFLDRVGMAGVVCAFCIHDADIACPVDMALGAISVCDILAKYPVHGYHGAVEPVEGAVWRVEREGRVDFLAKYVRRDKIDGKYLPEISGAEPIWYWHPTEKAK